MPKARKTFEMFPDDCRVCGALAKHFYFGALTCQACKMFFRRNGLFEKGNLECDFGGHCEINIHTRHACSACRLVKCFRSGMTTDRFRCVETNKSKINLSTLNLLQVDQSLLTTDQWTLLTNLIHCYEESEIISFIQYLKGSYNYSESVSTIYEANIYNLLKLFYDAIGKYIKLNGDLRQLSYEDRSIITPGLANNISCISGSFLAQYGHLCNLDRFINIVNKKYGKFTVEFQLWAKKFVDPDIVLAKLAISLFAFSQNSHNDYLSEFKNAARSNYLFSIQSKYVEVTWKYLLYKYGYRDAVKRFLDLVVWLTSMGSFAVHAQTLANHRNDLDLVIEQAELDLILDDIEVIETLN